MPGRRFRVDDVEVDPSRLLVRAQGRESRLRARSFQVLLYLLEHPGETVTRDQLLDRFWKDLSVSEDNLTHSITEIRKALGDSPREPKYLETIPKVGYRLAATVEQIEPEGTAPRRRRRLGWGLAWGLGAAIVAAAISAAAWRFHRPAGDAGGRKTVAVMFFENRTGNPEADWLREGLADMVLNGLSRSPQLSVLGRDELAGLRRRSGTSGPSPIRLPEALAIARASGAAAVALGAYAVLPDAARLDVQLYEAPAGRLLGAESVQVDKIEHLLARVDPLSAKLASRLGAGMGSGSAFPNLAEASTSDLEAYRCYSLGLEAARAYRSDEAVAWFTRAAGRDPGFAMAQARIGYAYVVAWGRPREAKPFLEGAFRRASALTARDRSQVYAWYALANEDYERAIKAYRELLAAEPADLEARLTLGRVLAGERRLDEAARVLEEALKLDPESGDVFNQLGLVYFELGRKQDGFAAARRYLTLAPQEANAHDSLGLLYQWNGQYDEAIAAYREALRLKPGAGMMMVHLGNAFYQTGRYRQAIEEYERSIRAGPSARERTRGLGHIAWVLWRKKDLARLRQVRDQFEREGRAWLFGNVLLGESPAPKAGEADSWRRQEWPHSGRGSRESLRSTYSALALAALHEGRNEDALAHAQLALRERPPYYEPDRSDDILAECYLGLGRLDLAIAEYRRVLEAWPRLALARYRLGLALARTGDQQAAAAEFRRFLAEWKDADDGVPEVMDARRRMGS